MRADTFLKTHAKPVMLIAISEPRWCGTGAIHLVMPRIFRHPEDRNFQICVLTGLKEILTRMNSWQKGR